MAKRTHTHTILLGISIRIVTHLNNIIRSFADFFYPSLLLLVLGHHFVLILYFVCCCRCQNIEMVALSAHTHIHNAKSHIFLVFSAKNYCNRRTTTKREEKKRRTHDKREIEQNNNDNTNNNT